MDTAAEVWPSVVKMERDRLTGLSAGYHTERLDVTVGGRVLDAGRACGGLMSLMTATDR